MQGAGPPIHLPQLVHPTDPYVGGPQNLKVIQDVCPPSGIPNDIREGHLLCASINWELALGFEDFSPSHLSIMVPFNYAFLYTAYAQLDLSFIHKLTECPPIF